jgi:hypothetical protein
MVASNILRGLREYLVGQPAVDADTVLALDGHPVAGREVCAVGLGEFE